MPRTNGPGQGSRAAGRGGPVALSDNRCFLSYRGRPMRIRSKQALSCGCGMLALCTLSTVARADKPFLLIPNSLVISSSTYDRSQGALASLAVGTTLPNTDAATTAAIASNNYVDVWNNDNVDGSFGVTSAIELTDVEPQSGVVFGAT